ncbi:MAG TPA: hypothetical protein VIF12_02330 [Micavibrio sp.]
MKKMKNYEGLRASLSPAAREESRIAKQEILQSLALIEFKRASGLQEQAPVEDVIEAVKAYYQKHTDEHKL